MYDILGIIKYPPVSASAADAPTYRSVLHLTSIGVFGVLRGICGTGAD